jgi:hypothetical protein
MVNILRVASNLASNQLTWGVMLHHPVIGVLAQRYADAHERGLDALAREMASSTADALEATRFLATLRELLAGERYILLDKDQKPTHEGERERMIGWRDPDGSVYVLPRLAKQAVERTLGLDRQGWVSEKTLYAQLDALGALASKDPERLTKVVWLASASQRVLHLTAAAMREEQGETPRA